MIIIKVKKETFDKHYLAGIDQFKFEGLLPLIFALFCNNNLKETITDDIIFEYIGRCSYTSIQEIPKDELAVIEAYYWQLKSKNKIDSEEAVYLLMASILKGETLVVIDSNLIENIDQIITLNFKSEISFVLKHNFQNITFKTL